MVLVLLGLLAPLVHLGQTAHLGHPGSLVPLGLQEQTALKARHISHLSFLIAPAQPT